MFINELSVGQSLAALFNCVFLNMTNGPGEVKYYQLSPAFLSINGDCIHYSNIYSHRILNSSVWPAE